MMPPDLVLFGSKLKGYREQFQLTPRELAASTGIPHTTLAAFEQGKASPSGDEVLILSDFFKCDYQFFISNEKTGPFEETDLLFRRYGEEFRKEDRWAVQEFLYLCACEEFLVHELGKRASTAIPRIPKGSHNRTQGMRAAASMRKALGYKPGELQKNIYSDLRKLGIHIFRRRLGNSNISGLTLKTPHAGNCILINYDEDPYRQRFSAAHEACHVLLDSEEEIIVSLAKNRNSDMEARANYFASYYLMPPEIIKSIPSKWSDQEAIRWANEFQVSAHALSIALRRERLISPEEQKSLLSVRVPKNMKRDPELPPDLTDLVRSRKEHFLERGLSGYYVDLCFDAFEQDMISRGRLAEMLLAEPSEITDLAAIFGRRLKHGD